MLHLARASLCLEGYLGGCLKLMKGSHKTVTNLLKILTAALVDVSGASYLRQQTCRLTAGGRSRAKRVTSAASWGLRGADSGSEPPSTKSFMKVSMQQSLRLECNYYIRRKFLQLHGFNVWRQPCSCHRKMHNPHPVHSTGNDAAPAKCFLTILNCLSSRR